jgi:hypothetical protein
MISTTDILNAQKHTVAIITLMITTAIYLYFVKKDPLFVEDKWLKQTIALLIGAVIYDLLLNKITNYLFVQFNLLNPKIKQALYDIALWSTIFTGLEIADSYLDNRIFNANNIFVKEKGAIIAVYVLYDLFVDDIIRGQIKNTLYQDLTCDIIKNGVAVYVGVTVLKNKFNHYSELIIVVGTYLLYHLFTKNLLLSQKNIIPY